MENLTEKIEKLKAENKALKNHSMLLEEILRLKGYEDCWKNLKEVAEEFNFFPMMDRLEETYLKFRGDL